MTIFVSRRVTFVIVRDLEPSQIYGGMFTTYLKILKYHLVSPTFFGATYRNFHWWDVMFFCPTNQEYELKISTTSVVIMQFFNLHQAMLFYIHKLRLLKNSSIDILRPYTRDAIYLSDVVINWFCSSRNKIFSAGLMSSKPLQSIQNTSWTITKMEES